MSEENLETVRSMYETFSGLAQGGDLTSYVLTHFDEDCVYEPVEEADPIHGRDALLNWNRRWFEAWDELRAEISELRDAEGETIMSAIVVRGLGAESGV